MTTIRANGIDIRHDVQGSGPWLILSHSLATDLSMWDAQVAVLATRFDLAVRTFAVLLCMPLIGERHDKGSLVGCEPFGRAHARQAIQPARAV